MKQDKGKVYLVGAGPGDPELLTLKAINKIREADVVLYDWLVTPEIMALLPENAERIFVGKRFGDLQDQTNRQHRINAILIEKSLAGKCCVRLKSGDPFMFGRGIEEVRALVDQGISVEVVPGITAGIAAACLFQIPITERNLTTSTIFCTGHTADYSLEHFQAIIAMLQEGTPLVMYMGLNNLEKIISRLRNSGVAEELNVCAISRVSMPDQELVYGKLGTIAAILREKGLKTPVVFLLGEHVFPVGYDRSVLDPSGNTELL
jgi:uroporphyrin-III C-methyltransferase